MKEEKKKGLTEEKTLFYAIWSKRCILWWISLSWFVTMKVSLSVGLCCKCREFVARRACFHDVAVLAAQYDTYSCPWDFMTWRQSW